MKKLIMAAGIAAIALSCSGKKQNPSGNDGQSLIAAGGQNEKELAESMKEFAAEEARRLEEEKSNITTFTFDKTMHDFGNVKPGSDNSCKFKVTNTGEKPLIIESVSASCGCTTPHKPEKPISPGKSDYIEVGFHPNPGQTDEIIKTVTVVANTDPKISDVKIRAFVK